MSEQSADKKTELFVKYKQTGDKALRNEIVMQYMNIVKYAAVSMRNMYQKFAEIDDIINEASIALMNAVETFDLSKNVKFETYASLKVRGAVIDFIRQQDAVSRGVRKFAKDYDKAFAELYSKLNREPSPEELAVCMGMSLSKLENSIAQSAAAQTLSFEELVVDTGFDVGEQLTEDGVWEAEYPVYYQEKIKILAQAISTLKEKERLVITLYYYEKLKFSDISKVLEVTESRICQIHSKAVSKLKNAMEEYLDIKRKS
jgi:RNA polymerase sigma factor for flagellar operon FliA